jgi:steroid delta-isomerase-like uncharacterized protein
LLEKIKNRGSIQMATNIKKIANDCMSAWNSHEVNKILSFYTDDCMFEDVAVGLVNHGKKEFTDFLNTSFINNPDINWELKTVFGTNDWIGVEYVMSGTHSHATRSLPGVRATGKAFSVRGALILQLRKDKVSRESAYYNIATMQQQLGLMPGQPK